jgi:hypothetical protein
MGIFLARLRINQENLPVHPDSREGVSISNHNLPVFSELRPDLKA